ncbi:pyroglutamyl-peptidase I [Salinivibrio sp. MA440]|uniref:pyroglutamyl-peptidase I n=1 Tax=Salinivibrio sp. MA440 TaxID=1909456 RepID=UPI0009897EE6|nr:pyroglutamyl-peptidase I [Salinivibrio sp. MA440]OOF06835.1 pyroglutamyl-peptidase I [Salinivibrio sp. MA440]
MHTILITGFEPFGGESENPSWQVAQALEGWQPNEECIVKAVRLPCTFDDSLPTLHSALESLSPVMVIALGQAGGRAEISLEKVAINYQNAPIPDNAGKQPHGTSVVPSGPNAYFSTLPLNRLANALNEAHHPASISYTAGTFVCNQVFYGLMHALAHHTEVRAGFIHIPYSPAQACKHRAPSMPVGDVVAAMKVAIELSLLDDDATTVCEGMLH